MTSRREFARVSLPPSSTTGPTQAAGATRGSARPTLPRYGIHRLPTTPTIAIIGAGASGTLLAVNLLRTGRAKVVLIERAGYFGPGLAYYTTSFAHLLNVPAGRMSAFSKPADDFTEWARQDIGDAAGNAFLARGLYGQYLTDLLERAAAEPGASASLSCVPEAAIDLILEGEQPAVVLASGRQIHADKIVLAYGNLPPQDPPIPGLADIGEARYVRDPWTRGSLDGLSPDDQVLIVGTGLTMIDVTLHLAARGMRGTIHAVSRRGLLPQPHRHLPAPPAKHQAPDISSWPDTAAGLLSAIREHVRAAEKNGTDWREAVTALRPVTAALWQKMPTSQRARFLAHLQPYWDVHRHRVAPTGEAAIRRMIDRSRLTVSAGRIASIRNEPRSVVVSVRPRGHATTIERRVARVINCTGPGTDLRRANRPFLNSLLDKGVLRQDALKLGIEAAADGAVLDASGAPSPVLWGIGPVLRAQLWETTAIPEIRVQAERLAARLTGSPA